MADNINISFKELILGLSKSLDLLTLRISKHSQRVTLISLKIADELKLSQSDTVNLFYASLLHDFGVISSRDKMDIMRFEHTNYRTHIEMGPKILNDYIAFSDILNIIGCHHDHWLGPNQSGLLKDNIPLLSQIIHLADRIEVLISDDGYILEQTQQIVNQITKFKGMWFHPKLVEVFNKLAGYEVFWLDLSSEFTSDILNEISPTDERVLSIDDVIKITSLFAKLIDQKSRYTKSHCLDGTELAVKLGSSLGWSESDLKSLRIAASLHDLGKLSVPDEILEKPGKLTPLEYAIIKKHPYYTYHILKTLTGFVDIAKWAAFHHEGLDGKGYPFGLGADLIPQGARIIAVADRFTALNEDRPYRKKLPIGQVIRILDSEVSHNIIDAEIMDCLKKVVAPDN